MTDSTITALAKAVNTQMSAHATSPGYSQTVTILRSYNPIFKPEDAELDTAQAVIYSVGRAEERILDRQIHTLNEYQIGIQIAKRITSSDQTDTTEQDAMTLLVQEIYDSMKGYDFNKDDGDQLNTGEEAWYIGSENTPLFDPDMMINNSIFFSHLLLRYRVVRS